MNDCNSTDLYVFVWSCLQFQLQMFDIVCSTSWASRDKCCELPGLVRTHQSVFCIIICFIKSYKPHVNQLILILFSVSGKAQTFKSNPELNVKLKYDPRLAHLSDHYAESQSETCTNASVK